MKNMKKSTSLILGIFLTLIIFGLGSIAPRLININNEFIPLSFFTHSTMLVFSLIAIYIFTKNSTIKFQFQKVKFKYYIYAILVTILAIPITQILITIILKMSGFQIDPSGNGFAPTTGMSSLQIFLFIFVWASICEEFLFRGFMQNFFEPLKSIGIRINKNFFISLPVLLSGILFGLAHLIILTSNTSGPMVFRTVVYASMLGLIAAYFQEKHKSIFPAIVIHMTGNLPLLIVSFIM